MPGMLHFIIATTGVELSSCSFPFVNILFIIINIFSIGCGFVC